MNAMYFEFAPGRLRDRRIEMGLTVRDVARRIGMAVTTIQNYENGWRTPAAHIVVALATALHCTPDALTVPVTWERIVGR